ncbi:uncharacterized protein LOC120475735 isoform X2 [Pimephales promelas]|uniref:uncharacterized protein LOC120475735 isoform X2 n=1 Tax=Pimephales promelas TaxID=90988 RepID=UPI001955AC7B|nr:uncharacterized protein LOC120475735 isoform X2 [Pimephales promelas]
MMKTTLLVVFLLTHSSETQDILTVSKISVQKHQTIIIPCLYDERYVSNRKYVSSGGVWVFSREVHSRVCVSDDREEKVFTATLSSAEKRDSGPYWCAVESSGSDPHARLDLEVIKGKARLHVSSQSVSGYERGSVSVLCHGAHLWCRLGGSCVGRGEESSDKTHVSGDGEALSVSLSELKIEDSGWYFCSDGKYQMPVHISVGKARPVTVPYTGHSTAVSQDNVAWGPSLLWRAVLGAMLPAIFCVAVALIGRNIRRKRRADPPGPSEGMSDQHWPSRSGRNEEVTCENLYKNTGIKQNIQGNEKNEEVKCENLYEMTEIKQNTQGNEKCEQVTCDDVYETMTGNTQNIQGNEKHSKVEDLYETMTGNKQIIQMTVILRCFS